MDWFQRLSIGLVIAFLCGGVVVYANDGKQEIRIEQNTEARKMHTQSIHKIDINIAEIQRDLARLVEIIDKKLD